MAKFQVGHSVAELGSGPEDSYHFVTGTSGSDLFPWIQTRI